VIAALFLACVPLLISGGSMEPTLHHDQIYQMCEADTIQRNDIIIFKFASRDLPLVKRVAGGPGDTLGARLPVPKWVTWETIPKSMFYVRSDNPANQFDSRRYGLVHQTQILGKIEEEGE
jgi:signal peptidase I